MPHQHSSSRRSWLGLTAAAVRLWVIAKIHSRTVVASHEALVLSQQLPAVTVCFGAVWKHRLGLAVCVVQVGLRKLLDAEGEVNVMKQELIALQPKLIETGTSTETCDFCAGR